MKFQFFFFFIFLFFGLGMFAQNHVLRDTVELPEVVVSSSRSATFSDGAKRIEIDSVTLASSATQNLGELLSKNTTLQLKTHGCPSAMQSVSIHSASASRTLVTWAGLPLNTSTLGSIDLSVVPTSAFNSLTIDYGAAGALYGSGAFGGAIVLEYIPDYSRKTSVKLSESVGSFGSWGNNLNFMSGNSKIQYNASYFFNKIDGDYPFYDEIKTSNEIRKNADSRTYGTIQYLYIKPISNLQIGLGAWYSVKYTSLPALMGGNANNAENQLDSSLRVFADISYKFKRSSLFLKIAYFDDYELYTKKLTPSDSLYSVYSQIYNKPFMSDLSYRCYVIENLKLDIGVVYKREEAFASGFAEYYVENSLAGVVAMRYKLGPWVSTASFRYEYHTAQESRPTFHLGSTFDLFKKRLQARIQFSQKYRYPTFNDKYWTDGMGNPELTSEYGNSIDAGLFSKILVRKEHSLDLDVSAYSLTINDMITWIPLQNGLWKPYNYAKVRNMGIETNVTDKIKVGNSVLLCQDLSVSLSKSDILETNNELTHTEGGSLTYVPAVQGTYSLKPEYKKFGAFISCSYMSRRYYHDDYYLDPVFLLSSGLSYKATLRRCYLNSTFSVNNILDTDYQIVRSYPMPGRNFMLSVQIGIK